MITVKLTKLEAEVLLSTAGQMKDDFEDYYSFMSKAKLRKYSNAFDSGLGKLSAVFHTSKKKHTFVKS